MYQMCHFLYTFGEILYDFFVVGLRVLLVVEKKPVYR